MPRKAMAGFILAATLACGLVANSAGADTAFRVGCFARGDNDLFLLDPQTFSLPQQGDEFLSYIQLCLAVDGHPRVDGDFFR